MDPCICETDLSVYGYLPWTPLSVKLICLLMDISHGPLYLWNWSVCWWISPMYPSICDTDWSVDGYLPWTTPFVKLICLLMEISHVSLYLWYWMVSWWISPMDHSICEIDLSVDGYLLRIPLPVCDTDWSVEGYVPWTPLSVKLICLLMDISHGYLYLWHWLVCWGICPMDPFICETDLCVDRYLP